MKIRSAYRRGLEATCEIAKQLDKIEREELYLDLMPEFLDYVTEHLKINKRTYYNIIETGRIVDQLKEAGLRLPNNETQVLELARLEPPMRPAVWIEVLTKYEHEEDLITAEDVREVVEQRRAFKASADTKETETEDQLEVDMENGDSDNGDAPAPKAKAKAAEATLVYSEKAEVALARIRKVCGDQVADAIDAGALSLSEREIRAWADQEDDMMRSLVYYLVQHWSLAKALAFVNRPIEGSTDVNDLLLIAHSAGGIVVVNFDNRAKITVELVKKR